MHPAACPCTPLVFSHNDSLKKRAHNGRTAQKNVRPSTEMCAPGAVCTLNFEHCQCMKLRARPATGAHISADECTIFGAVHPECARFLSYSSLLHIRRVHGGIHGRTVLEYVHPVGNQNKSLISDTGFVHIFHYHICDWRNTNVHFVIEIEKRYK